MRICSLAAITAILVAGSISAVQAEMNLDEAPPYALDPYAAPIESDVTAFDLSGPAESPYCLAVSDKSVFLLKSSGKKKKWKTLDVIQPKGAGVGGGFIEVPAESRRRSSAAPIRFFVTTAHPDGRIQTWFYASEKGVTKIEGQTTGRLYRRDGPVLFSQKAGGETASPVVVEMVLPGKLPKSIGGLSLPAGTSLFGFARVSDAESGEILRIGEDEVELWIKDRRVSQATLRIGNPPSPGVDKGVPASIRWQVPPAVIDDPGGGQVIVVAVNNPDVAGGGFFDRREKYMSRLAVFKIKRNGNSSALELAGATPLRDGALSAVTVHDGRAVVAVVDTDNRRTRLFRLGEAGSRKEARRARKF